MLLTTTTTAAEIGRWISIGTPAAIPAEASAAPTNNATLHVPWIADITRRSNRRSTATASMFIATSIRPASKPMPRKSRASDASSSAAGRSANPTPIAGMPPRTIRRPPHHRIAGSATRVPASSPTAKPVRAIPNPEASNPACSLM